MVETMGAGGGFLDYDGDGDLDIYLVNGATHPGSTHTGAPPTNALYRNDGEGRFTDTTALAGVGDTGFGMNQRKGAKGARAQSETPSALIPSLRLCVLAPLRCLFPCSSLRSLRLCVIFSSPHPRRP